MHKPIPDEGPVKGSFVSQEELDLLLDDYYDARGWTKQGVPSKKKLDALGLQEYTKILEGKEE
jgi:aldehyde:ferredoxin oxidoreductase